MASDDLTIEVPGSSSLAQPAREALEACLVEYGSDVLREAGRLEATMHVGPGAAMITNSMIQEANLLGRRGHIQPRTSKFKHFLTVTTYVAAAVGGAFAGNLNTPVGSIGFAASVIVGILALLAGRE
ncbi:hypothetical protein [Kitasatospora terrestris]|uniref:DUF2335 domain-containing protein n=1 Tax=Kitasatospora terrestris TaxID=258051 RepID=A0ABP9DWD5_9ACTN